jgi:ABC-type sugar transport system ATPase subunit
VLITHRLREVLQSADDVTVLRDGKVVYAARAHETDAAALLTALGAVAGPDPTKSDRDEAPRAFGGADRMSAAPVLELLGVSTPRLRRISLRLEGGQILGVTGLEGCGKSDIVHLIDGSLRMRAGELRVLGTPVDIRSPHQALRVGIGIVPADRAAFGGIGELSLSTNLFLPQRRAHMRAGWYRRSEARRAAGAALRKFGVVPPEPDRQFWTLSGGNQQKTIVGRWLVFPRNLLILHEPTLGVDVVSRAALYEHIRAAARDGLAVLIVSSDVTELVELCDDIVVIAEGDVTGTLSGDDRTTEEITRLSFGVTRDV